MKCHYTFNKAVVGVKKATENKYGPQRALSSWEAHGRRLIQLLSLRGIVQPTFRNNFVCVCACGIIT